MHRSVKTNNNLYVSEPIQFKPVLSKFQQYYGSSHSKLVSAMSATDGIKEVIFDFFSFLLTLPLIPSSKMFLWQIVLLGEAHWNCPPWSGTILTICMSCFTTGGSGKEHRTNKPPSTGRVWERSKGNTTCPTTSQNPSVWHPSWLNKVYTTRKNYESEWLAKDNPEANPITIEPRDCKPRDRAVLLGSLTPLLSTRVPFPNKISCFVSTCVSSDNSFPSVRQEPSPGRGPPSCHKWRLWWGLFFTATGILTTLGTHGPACLPMDQTQWLQLGLFVPGFLLMWTTGQSAPTGKEQEILLTSLPFPFSFLSLALPILPLFSCPPVLDTGVWPKGLSLSWELETDHLLLAKS